MRKIVCILCVMVVVGGAVYAGGTQASGEMEEPKEEIAFFFGGSNRTQILQSVVQIFNEQATGTTVDLVVTSQDYQTALQARVASGNPPDIASHLVGQVLVQYVNAGHIRDISDESFLDFVIPGGLDRFTIDGGVYAFPLDSQMWGIFYNKDLFSRAGITAFPNTSGGLVQAVEALKEADIVPFGLALQAAWTIGQAVYVGGSPALYDAAATDIEGLQAGRFDFDRPGTRAVEAALNLIIENAQPNAAGTDLSGQYAAFALERVAMMPQGNWSILQLRELNPDMNAGLAALPLTDDPGETRFPVAYPNALTVFDTPRIDGVREFLNFFLDKSGPATIYYDSIGIPTGIRGEAKNIDPMNAEVIAAMEKGLVVPWLQDLLPPGMSGEINTEIQDYAVRDASSRTSLASILNAILEDRTR